MRGIRAVTVPSDKENTEGNRTAIQCSQRLRRAVSRGMMKGTRRLPGETRKSPGEALGWFLDDK